MRIYVAASYPRKAEARRIANRLTELGHIIVTSRWVHEDEGYDKDERGETEAELYERLSEAAVRDIEDIKKADYLVCLTDGEKQLTHGGRHSELGMALELGKGVAIIGPRESVFHYHPDVKVYVDEGDFWYDMDPEYGT